MRRVIYGRSKLASFISVWDTSRTGGTGSNTVKIEFSSTLFQQCTIDWGDGSNSVINTFNDSQLTHVYSISGIYTIKIKGWWFFISGNDFKNKCISILDFGDLKVGINTLNALKAINMNMAQGKPSYVDPQSGLLAGNSAMTAVNGINSWDFSTFTNLYNTFNQCINFNQALSFPTTNVTNMNNMFYNCTKLNSMINFNTAKVTTMFEMFRLCVNMNSPIIFSDTSKVTNMGRMFTSCAKFNQPLAFNTSSVTSFNSMFFGCSVFNQDISSWDVTNVTDMGAMFQNATAFNQDISAWNFNKDVSINVFMAGKTSANYNAAYYDSLLQKWAAVFIGVGRTASKNTNMGTIKYTAAGKPYRDALVADGWTITDGGMI